MAFAFNISTLFLRLWVIVILWGWFVVPVFNLPDLSVPQAIGLYSLVRVFSMKAKDIELTNDEYSKEVEAVFRSSIVWAALLIILGVGYFCK